MTYQTAYPFAHIPLVDEKSFRADNRAALFNQIKDNDYYCVKIIAKERLRYFIKVP
ncbi:MAG: hypothetical protein HDS66_09415 [Bacteroidales bacterium]|nr:hypothetical protein [Bacteroidales bacterium]